MRTPLFCYVALIIGVVFSSHAQEMRFEKGGRVSYQGQILQKPKDILPIILQRNSPEITTAFNRYKSNRGAALVFSSIGGFGIGYSLGGAIAGRPINGGLLAGGAGVLGIGLLFGSSSTKALKQVVDLYNGTTTPQVSFRPFIKDDGTMTHAGITIGF